MCVCACVLYHLSVCFHSGILTISPLLRNLLYPKAALPSCLSNSSIPSPSSFLPTKPRPSPPGYTKLHQFCFTKHSRLNKCLGNTNKDPTSPAGAVTCWKETVSENEKLIWTLCRVKLSAPLSWLHSQHRICCNLMTREIHHSLHSSDGEHWVCVMGFLVRQSIWELPCNETSLWAHQHRSIIKNWF